LRFSRYLAQIVLLLWLVPLSFGWFVLKSQKKAIRAEIRDHIYQGLTDKDLVRIAIHERDQTGLNSPLIWHQPDEFEYLGNMYDVIETEYHSDSIIYVSFLDNKESEINIKIDQLALLALGQNSDSREFEHSLIDFVSKLYFQKGYHSFFDSKYQSLDNYPYDDEYSFNYLMDILRPPRKIS